MVDSGTRTPGWVQVPALPLHDSGPWAGTGQILSSPIYKIDNPNPYFISVPREQKNIIIN